MFNPTELFKTRVSAHIKLLNRYLRYIFNGHFMIALFFIIVTIAVYYQRWLREVSETFPAAMVIAIALSFVVMYNPIQSFLKEPDKVFLIVKELEISRYFNLAILYNYITQLYIVLFVIAAISPLYFTFYPERPLLINGLIVVIILVMKFWNMILTWRLLQVDHALLRFSELVIRIVLTFLLFYSLVTLQYFLIVGTVYVIYLNVAYFMARKDARINWERLIQNDAERLALFYRFVSLFADVPHVKSRMRKRRWLASLVHKHTSFQQKDTYTYLHRLTFLRSSDYFSLYIRLTVIAIVFIVFIPNNWIKLALGLLFLYMTSFQLQSLYYHHRTNIWLDLYPVNESESQTTFLTFSKQLSVVQTIILSLTFLAIGNIIFFIAMLLLGIVFTIGFHQSYVKKKLKTAGS